MDAYIIVTNNPLAEAEYPQITEFVSSCAGDVLVRVRDRIHMGAKLINHPLSGGVLPGISPYKSLIISAPGKGGSKKTDHTSLQLIENAIRQHKENPSGFEGYDKSTLEDFMIIDLDMLNSALKR